MSRPSYTPVCPNHGAKLEGCGFPLPEKGVGICPISGADFEFEAEVDKKKMVKDKFGAMKPTLDWKLTGEEK